MYNDTTIYSVTINDVTAKGTFKKLAALFGVDAVKNAIADFYADSHWSESNQCFVPLKEMNEQYLRNATVSHLEKQLTAYINSLKNSKSLTLKEFFKLVTNGITQSSELQKLAKELAERVKTQNSYNPYL